MIKARTWFSLFIMGVATIAATASCGSGSDEGTGDKGAGGGSVLVGGASGVSGAGRGSVGRAGTSNSGGNSGAGSSDVNSPVSNLGAPCTSDKQCGNGFLCLTASSTELSGAGPAGGLCTLACTGTTDCTAVEPGSDCFNFGTSTAPKQYCLLGCAQGGDDTTAPSKCQGRADISCVDLSSADATSAEPFCIPLCYSDADCGANLYCDKGSGLCSKTKPPAGDPVGTACTPATTTAAGATVAGSNNCEGFCIRTSANNVTPAKGVCAEFCSGLLDCGFKGTQPGGLCYGQLSDEFGLFDLGYCLPSCDCTDTCPFPGDMCRAWTTAQKDFVTDLGAPGLCAPDITGSVELTACGSGEAGAGGTSGVNGTAGVPGSEAGASGGP